MYTYLWTEDQTDKSGFLFWKTIMNTLFPDVIVESKGNYSKLMKAMQGITDDGNKYIIALDHSFDNDQIVREMKKIKETAIKNDNIYELDIISFEYTLLEFDKLIQWIYDVEDEFLVKRSKQIYIREKLLTAINCKEDYKLIPEIKDFVKEIDMYNIEQLASRLLFQLTRNTGFEVVKGKLGKCWQVDCCGLQNRSEDDLCGLNESKPNITEKMTEIFKFTRLEKEFAHLGLGVLYVDCL